MLQERIFLKYRRREDIPYCPLCGTVLKWVRVWGEGWIPCDATPVLFERGAGRYRIVKRGELLTDCKIYRGGEAGRLEYGLQPHALTCGGKHE